MTTEYLQDPMTPSLDDFLANPVLSKPFYDRSTTELVFSQVFSLLYVSQYGKLLQTQDLRYAGHFGYQPRQLMAFEYGQDAMPLAHNLTTFAHILNAINVEEVRGSHALTPYQKDLALFSGGTHDAIEGVVGDMPRGTKTPEFRKHEAVERWKMLKSTFDGVLPMRFLKEVDAIIGHENMGIEHDYVEIGHALSQFSAGMRVGRICLMLKEVGLHLTPWIGIEGDSERVRNMSAMAITVTKATSGDLAHFAEKGYWIAAETLRHHADKLIQLEEELGPLAHI